MALSTTRRRSVESQLEATNEPFLPIASANKSSTFSISSTFILLIILTFWCISNLISSSFHICVSSRKLDMYCISGGLNGLNSSSMIHNNVDKPKQEEDKMVAVSSFNVNSSATLTVTKDDVANAYSVVEKKLQKIRSFATATSIKDNSATKSCDGRGIFVYDLPPKFNKELVSQCKDLLPWTDLCDYFDNEGKGQPIPKLGKGWYRTHQYSLELIFHSKLLNHPCLVSNPNEAKIFYVPFYGGLDILRWHFKNVSSDIKDALSNELLQHLQTQNTWSKNMGKDHMFVLGKISWDFRRRENDSWGSNFLSNENMSNSYKFLIERQPWESKDIGIPHPTHFHPSSDDDIIQWQEKISNLERKSLVTFAGAARPGQSESIRSFLIKNCVENDRDCRFLDCSSSRCTNPEDIITAFTESEFCLQPPGDSPTRKSVFDSLISGCIPVLFDPFTAYYQYPWHLPENYKRYSVYIDKEEVRQGKINVIEVLKGIGKEERKEMRRFIVYELLPGLVYGDSNSKFQKFRDAYEIVMENMVRMVTK